MEDITPIDDHMDGDNSGLSSNMKNNLLEAFKWMRIVSIIQFVFLGLAALSIINLLIRLAGIPSYYRGNMQTQMLLVLLILGVGFFLAFTLFKAGNSYKKYAESGDRAEMEMAFDKQRLFWVVSGILTIIVGAIYLILFLTTLGKGGIF